MNCTLCEEKLNHLSVSCFDAIRGGMFHICFDCLNEYKEKNPDKSFNDLALKISIDVHEKFNPDNITKKERIRK